MGRLSIVVVYSLSVCASDVLCRDLLSQCEAGHKVAKTQGRALGCVNSGQTRGDLPPLKRGAAAHLGGIPYDRPPLLLSPERHHFAQRVGGGGL